MTFTFDTHDTLEWFESSRISVYGTAGMLEFGFLRRRGCTPTRPLRSPRGLDGVDSELLHQALRSYRAEQVLGTAELENLSNFRTEMRGFVQSVRTGAPIVSPVADALAVARITDACYRS